MSRKRITLIAYTDLDQMPRVFNTAEDAEVVLQAILANRIPHYYPIVVRASEKVLTQTTRRIAFLIYVDLDAVPGTFHTIDSARMVVGHILTENIGHYNPIVSVAPENLQPTQIDLKPLSKALTELYGEIKIDFTTPPPVENINIDFNIIKGYN